jgi:hypothetical protein
MRPMRVRFVETALRHGAKGLESFSISCTGLVRVLQVEINNAQGENMCMLKISAFYKQSSDSYCIIARSGRLLLIDNCDALQAPKLRESTHQLLTLK